MDHDPLCNPNNEYESFLVEDGHMSLDRRCDCDLIAKVRADEREQAEARIRSHADYRASFTCGCRPGDYYNCEHYGADMAIERVRGVL